jgi:hypothetical protein
VTASLAQQFISHLVPLIRSGVPGANLLDWITKVAWETFLMVTRVLATLDGFAIEGGFDVAGCPATCFGPAAALGMCDAPGDAAGAWADYEKILDLVPELGLAGVRITLEWARLEPFAGVVDAQAFERYGRAIRHAKAMGLWVTGVLVDAAWPSWLGQEAWLMPWTVDRVIHHATRVLDAYGAELDALVAFARPAELVDDGFMTASRPPYRRHALMDARSARLQIAESVAALPASTLWTTEFVEVPLVPSRAAMQTVLRSVGGIGEVHVRSLVRGAGPTAAAAGMVANDHDGWRTSIAPAVCDAWR